MMCNKCQCHLFQWNMTVVEIYHLETLALILMAVYYRAMVYSVYIQAHHFQMVSVDHKTLTQLMV